MDARTVVPDTELGPDVRRLPADIPFPLPPVNVTFVDGDVPTLFDTGCGTTGSWDSLQAAATAQGVDLARVERVVLTHAHLDHAGNAARIRAETGAEVWIHEAEADLLEQWDDVQDARNDAYEAGLRRAGLPVKVLEKLAVRGRDVDVMMSSCTVDRRLKDGDLIDTGARGFRVIHTPGHTAGSAIYVDEPNGFAVTGDTILQNITPNALSVQREETGALARYLKTLERIRDLPLDVMVPGHGPAFRGLDSTIDRAFRLYHARHQRIVGFLQQAPRPLTVWDVVEHEWPEGQKGAAFLMTSEIQGHMDILVADGLVGVTEPEDRNDEGEAALYRLDAAAPSR